MVLVVRKARFFRLIPFPTFTRHLSTYDGSLVQLADDIVTVYKDLNSKLEYSMPSHQLGKIKQKILCNSYALSPLKIKIMENGEQLSAFLKDYSPDYPNIMYGRFTRCEKSFAIIPYNKEDNLVLMGISVMLLRLSLGSSPLKAFWVEDMVEDFHEKLQQMKEVNRVFKYNIQHSLKTIPKSLIEEKIQSLVGDSSPILKLVSTFLRLKILDDDGNDCRGETHLTGIPVVGEITKVLFNIYLMDTIDKDFALIFPGIAFCRFLNEIFIMTKKKVLFDFKHAHKILGEHRLMGNLTSMGPEDEPLHCHFNKLLYLSSNGKINLCDPEDDS